MNSEKIMELEKEYLMQTYERGKAVFDSGNSSYLYDTEGKKYLDFAGGIATASLGHGNKVIANAIAKQANKLISASNLFYTEQQVILAEKLAKISNLKKCFFSNSGAESVEAAIKLARKFTGKTEIIAAQNSFHGRTFGALSVTWKEKFRKPFEPLVPGMNFIQYNDTKALQGAITDNTAAFIIEPIQGEAGVIVPDNGYLKECKKICEEKNCLLIADEIQTNMRTGKFFAYQHEGILPDIVTVAKGIGNGVPIGITIASEKVAEGFKFGDHGSTFGGNSLSCTAANATIDFVLKNNIINKAAENGEYFRKELNKLKKDHNSIKEVRGKGLMIGVELSAEAKPIVQKCLSKGLIINKCGDYVLRFLPPLIITKKQIAEGIDILKELL